MSFFFVERPRRHSAVIARPRPDGVRGSSNYTCRVGGWGVGGGQGRCTVTSTRPPPVSTTRRCSNPQPSHFFCHPLTPPSSFFSRLFSSQDCPPSLPPHRPSSPFPPSNPPTSISLPGLEERIKKKNTTWRYLVLTLPPAVRWRI